MKRKLNSNLLIFIFNVNLFLLQIVFFLSWSGTTSNDREKKLVSDVQGAVDDVQVYNSNLNDLVPPAPAPVVHDGRDERDRRDLSDGGDGKGDGPARQGSIGISRQESNNYTWNWNWDGRADVKCRANRFLYLVRHGQYYGNGPYEKHLSPMGQEQAVKAGEKLLSYNLTWHRFLSSASIRAAETADIIHRYINHLPVEYTEELREGWPTFPDPPTPGHWDKNNQIFQNDIPRLDLAFRKYIHRADPNVNVDQNELIVAHGNVIAYTILRALQVPPTRWLKVAVLQGSITLLQIEPNGDVALRILGDVGHLSKSQWSG